MTGSGPTKQNRARNKAYPMGPTEQTLRVTARAQPLLRSCSRIHHTLCPSKCGRRSCKDLSVSCRKSSTAIYGYMSAGRQIGKRQAAISYERRQHNLQGEKIPPVTIHAELCFMGSVAREHSSGLRADGKGFSGRCDEYT